MERTENVFQTAEKKSKNILIIRIVAGVLIALGVIAVALFQTMQTEKARQLMTVGNFTELLVSETNVTVTTNDFDYSGIYYYEKKESKPTSFLYYVFFEDEDGFYTMVLESKKDYRDDNDLAREDRPVRTFYGTIKTDPKRYQNKQQLQEVYELSSSEAESALTNYYVDATRTRGTSIPGWVFFAILPIILAGTNISAVLRRRKYKQRMENFGVTEASYLSLDRELEGEIFKNARNLILTKSWIFSKVAASTYLFPLSKVVWVYQSITKHYTNGIRSGTTYALNLCFNDGEMETITSSKKQVDALQDFVAERCPNAILAFSDDLKDLWASNKEEFCRLAATSCRAAAEQAADGQFAVAPAPAQIEEEDRYGSDDRFAPRPDDNA